MCKWGTSKEVLVKIPDDLSSTGKVKWKNALIDICIADIVNALQQGGMDMRGSCCGHGEYIGDIHLQDERILLVLDKDQATLFWHSRSLFYLQCLYRSLRWEWRPLLRLIYMRFSRAFYG